MKTLDEVKSDSPLLVEVYDKIDGDEFKWTPGRTTGNVNTESEEIEVTITGEKTEYYHVGDEVRFREDETSFI